MTEVATLLLALAAVMTAIFAFISQRRSANLTAKQDEFRNLSEQVEKLQKRQDELGEKNDSLRQINTLLREEIFMLRLLLRRHNIAVPKSKVFPDFDEVSGGTES